MLWLYRIFIMTLKRDSNYCSLWTGHNLIVGYDDIYIIMHHTQIIGYDHLLLHYERPNFLLDITLVTTLIQSIHHEKNTSIKIHQ